MSYRPDFYLPADTDFWWSCDCTKEEWQKQYNTGIEGRPSQKRCTVCLQTAEFFRKAKDEQAAIILQFYASRATISAWLAVSISDGTNVSIPKNVVASAAGWNEPLR